MQESIETTTNKNKTSKGWMICSVILLILLVCMSTYAIAATINKRDDGPTPSGGESDDVVALREEISAKDAKLNEIKNLVNVDSVNEVTSELIAEKMYNKNYVYFPEAGLKFKIPDSMKSISYLHTNGSISFWAVPKNFQYMPDFADPHMNHGGQAGIAISKKVADKQKVCNSNNIPADLICTGNDRILDAAVDGYEILFMGPHSVYSQDENSRKDEGAALKILKEALSNKDNYSKI